MPYITSQFLTRGLCDRPAIIPKESMNLAFLGQFVEIEEDVVFTVEYSVRSAQEAVYGRMALKKKPTEMYHEDHHPMVLTQAMKLIKDGTKWGTVSGSMEDWANYCLVTCNPTPVLHAEAVGRERLKPCTPTTPFHASLIQVR